MRDSRDRLAAEARARRRIAERAHEQTPVADPRDLVGAVVVTFNDANHIGGVLRRLTRRVAAVAVVDLGSKDGTLAVARRELPSAVTAELRTEAGFGAAFNTGVRLLEQPFLLLLHGDARPRPDSVAHLLEDVEPDRRHTGCAGVRVTSEHGELERSAGFRPTVRSRASARLLRSARRYAAYYIRRPASYVPTQRTYVGWVSDTMMMVRRDAWEQVEGMDEGYFHAYGDVDFCLRLNEAGWRVVHEIRARAIHLDRVVESRSSVRRARRRFYARHGARRHLRRLLGR